MPGINYGPGNRLGTQAQTSRETRPDTVYKAYHMQTRSFLFAQGTPKTEALDGSFVAKTIIVDNLSSCYLYISAAERWAIPLATQQVFPVQGAAQIALSWSTPQGVAQPADNGQPAIVQWLEKDVLLAPTTR